ncbi:MAG: cysteine dioxygenase family protein, partial [Solirubrobacteraceae bacterium]|nr:cysteine dioxygenase family protein [Solirubrobacteraceae bacterium]
MSLSTLTTVSPVAPAPPQAPLVRTGDLTPTELLGVAHGLAVQQNLWHPHVRHDPLQRTYHEVARTDRYSAWLICWMPGHDTGFHDHDGSGGVGLVLRGQVTESRLPVGVSAPVERVCSRGQHFSFAAHDIHRVHHFGDQPAVTLHVYSPVLVRMGSYEIAPNGTLRRHTLDETEELRP